MVVFPLFSSSLLFLPLFFPLSLPLSLPPSPSSLSFLPPPQAQFHQNKLDLALISLDRATAINSSNPIPRFHRARVLETLGRLEVCAWEDLRCVHKDRSKVRSSIAKYELKDEVKLLLAVYNGSPSPSPPLLSFSFFLPFSSSPFSIGCPSSAGRADQQLAQRAQPLHCQGKGRQVTSLQAIVVSLPGPPTIQF